MQVLLTEGPAILQGSHMYNQDPHLRRRQDRLRFFGYGAMTIVTLLLAVLSIYFVLGYRVNTALEVEQGGLLKFDSRPRGAIVTLNGARANPTRYQVNAAAGQHQVAYSRPGYAPWAKTVTLSAGEVLWLEYARLIPTTIETAPLFNLPAVHQIKTAPNRQRMLVHETADSRNYLLLDASNERQVRQEPLSLPDGLLSVVEAGQPSTIDIIGWSRDSQVVLLKHSFNQASVEYIRLPLDQPQQAENVSRQFSLPLVALQFADGSNSVFYGLSSQEQSLYRLDRGAPQRPSLVANNVLAYDDLNESAIAYVSGPRAGSPNRELQVWNKNGNRQLLGSSTDQTPVQLRYNQYYSHTYLTEVRGSSLTVTEDPLDDDSRVMASQSLSFEPSLMSVSPGNRFISLQRDSGVAVYDLELARLNSFAAPGEGGRPLQWADDHHLALTSDNKLRLVEFDGTNLQPIAASAAGYDVLIGTEGRVLLSLTRNQDGFGLQASQLLTVADR